MSRASGLSSKAPTRARTRVSTKTSQTTWTEEEDSILSQLMENEQSATPEMIAKKFPNKTQQQVMDRWNKVLNPELIKGSWTTEEDEIITQWVNEHGARNWSTLAATLPGRLGKQCRERWVNNLSPDLVHQPWSAEEDQILIEHQQKWGNKWAKIAQLLPGRTDNSVKNRWNSSLKRKLERIARGEAPVNKRGRKPKRPSNAPDVAPTTETKTTIMITRIEPVLDDHIEVVVKDDKVDSPEEKEEIQSPQEESTKEMPKPDLGGVDLTIPSPAIQTPLLLSPFMQMSPILMKDSPFFPLWSPGSNSDLKQSAILKSPLPFSLDKSDALDPAKAADLKFFN